MTAYEMADLAFSSFANSIATWGMFLSLVTAYLVTAYLVGAKLTRTQVIVLTTMYLVVSAMAVWSISAYISGGTQLAMRAFPDSAGNFFAANPWAPFAIGLIDSLVVAMSLKFMWDVRHRKESTPH